MAPSPSDRPQRTFSLTSGTLTQLLAGFACFLAAFVLPLTFTELRGVNRYILIAFGCIMLTLGVVNLLFGRRLSRVMARAGKRSRVVIPREGVGYLAIMLVLAVGGLLGSRNMPLMLFGLMCGPFVLNGAIVYHMLRGISVLRHCPRSAHCGDFVTVELEVTNSKRWLSSRMLEIRDTIRDVDRRGPEYEPTVTFVRIPGSECRAGRYQIRFERRGRYEVGPARVSSRFPLGIGERGQLLNTTSELIIHPQIGTLLPAWREQAREVAESSHQTRSRTGMFDDEFHRIREYRSDDNPRSIHWRSSAKRGELMVREYQQQRHADSVVLLDLPETPDWSDNASELAISLAATLCVEQARAASGSRFLLGLATDTNQLVCSRSPGTFRDEALHILATCQRSKKANIDGLLSELAQTHPLREDRVILITPRPEEAQIAVQRLAADGQKETLDIVSRTTILHATVPHMLTLVQLPDSAVGNLPLKPLRPAGAATQQEVAV